MDARQLIWAAAHDMDPDKFDNLINSYVAGQTKELREALDGYATEFCKEAWAKLAEQGFIENGWMQITNEGLQRTLYEFSDFVVARAALSQVSKEEGKNGV